MLAAKFDITLDRAADYSFVLTIQNQAGSAVDLTTNVTFYADIREVASKKEALDITPVASNPTYGQVTFTLTKAQTKTLKAGSGIYEWDLFMDRGSPAVRSRLLYGSVTVRPQTTNDA